MFLQLSKELLSQPDFASRLELASSHVCDNGFENMKDIKLCAESFYRKLLAADIYSVGENRIRNNTTVTLIKAAEGHSDSLGEDYGLNKVSFFFISCTDFKTFFLRCKLTVS